MKIKFDSDDDLPLNILIEIYNVTIAVRVIFYENENYYQQVFLDEYLYKLQKRTQRWKLSRTTKLNRKMKKKIYNLRNKKFLYFACLFINYHYIIDSSYTYCYLIKKKHLLPYYITNNKLKEVLYY